MLPVLYVIVPCYNQEDYVSECIESILAQKTDFRYEVLVGDDCSDDSTPEIVKKYAEKFALDTVIVDTAGRLHVKENLMNELRKMDRVVTREYPEADFLKLLVLDATTGQNAVNQARVFDEAVELDGLVLTKLDGTAKGGIALAIQSELSVPVKYIGVGESIDDLQKFNSDEFVNALFTVAE